MTSHRQAETAPQAMFRLGVARQLANKPDEAAETFRAFLANYTAHPLAAEAQLRYGEMLAKLGHFAEAEQQLREAAARPDFALADQAILAQADTLAAMGRPAEGIEHLADFKTRFPDSPHKYMAQIAEGRYAMQGGQTAQTIELLMPLVAEEQLSTPEAAEARYWLARALLLDNRPAEALEVASEHRTYTDTPWAALLLLSTADAAYALGEIARAAELYPQVVEAEPNSFEAPRACYMAAFTAMQTRNLAAAREHAEAFLERYPDYDRAPMMSAIAAETLLQQGEHTAAAERYAQLVAEHPQHADAFAWRLRQVWALHLAGDYEAALPVNTELLERLEAGPERNEARYLLGLNQLARKQLSAGRETITTLIAEEPEWPRAAEALFYLGHALLQAEEHAAALEILSQIPEDYPDSPQAPEALLAAAEAAAHEDDIPQGRKSYAQWLELAPRDAPQRPHVLFHLAILAASEEDVEEAIALFTELLNDYPAHELALPTYQYRASVFHSLGDLDSALADVEHILAADPDAEAAANAHFIAGLSYSAQENTAQAIAAFERMLELSPDHVDVDTARFELGVAYFFAEQFDTAAATFEKLQSNAPDTEYSVYCTYYLAEILSKQDRPEDALPLFRQVVEATDDAEILAMAFNWLGHHAADAGEHTAAITFFGEQLKQDFDFVEWVIDGKLALAKSLAATGEAEEAIELFNDALGQLPADDQPETLQTAIEAAIHLTDWAQARQWHTTLVERFPDMAEMPEINLLAGQLLHGEGQTQQAIDHYHRLAAATEGRTSAIAQLAAAELLYQTQQYQAAGRDALSVAYAFSYEDLQPEALWLAAESLRLQGQTARAQETYTRLVEKFPHSEQAAVAHERLSTLAE